MKYAPAVLALVLALVGGGIPASRPAEPGSGLSLGELLARVAPEQGFRSRIALGDSIAKLAREGAIDRAKLEKLYADRRPRELTEALEAASDRPIVLTRENARLYVNLLWPLGLANYLRANERSPIKGPSLANFASTGGWTLGREPNGAAYFNRLRVVELTPEQEALVLRVAESTFRPCCNNSTFFQDCNHGSALLGLLELGAAQGLTEEELYREALAFNSFWFPQNYVFIALYFKAVKGRDWEAVDPREAMSFAYSSAGGSARVREELAKIPNLLPRGEVSGAFCAV